MVILILAGFIGHRFIIIFEDNVTEHRVCIVFDFIKVKGPWFFLREIN